MEGLEQLVETKKISAEDAEKLKDLAPGSFCSHKSWGFGRIRSWDMAVDQVVIDFDSKSGHAMQFAYAAESLTPLPPNHLLARKRTGLDGLKAQAAADPAAFMRCAIQSLGPAATAETLERTLIDGIIDPADWKKWWDGARRAMRKAGGFTIPTGKTAPFKLEESAPAGGGETYESATEKRGTLPLLEAAENLLRNPPPAGNPAAFVDRVNDAIRKAPASQRAAKLKLALARDDIAATAGISAPPDVATPALALAMGNELPGVLSGLTAAHQTRIIRLVQEAGPSEWQALASRLLAGASARLVGSLRDSYAAAGRTPDFVELIRRGLREQTLSSEALVWIVRNRTGDLAPLVEPRLFASLLAGIEADQMGGRKSSKLRDTVIEDRSLFGDVLKNADADAVRDVTRALILTTVFDEMDKRSLLGRIVKLFPDIGALVAAAGPKQRSGEAAEARDASLEPLIVSWTSLERRKAELDDLVNRLIPANTQEIAVARSYGDLRENAEFKFAKEQQRVLGARRAELEADIARAKGTDFKGVDASRAAIGTVVTVATPTGDETYTILGAWDGDPARHILSYLTPVARALITRAPGESVDLPAAGGETRRVTVKSVAPFAP